MRTLGILTLLVALGAPLRAGVVFELETVDRSRESAEPRRVQLSAEGEKLRIETLVDEGEPRPPTMIYRGDLEAMIVVDHRERRSFRLDREVMALLALEMTSAFREAYERAQTLPPDQRAMLEEARRQMAAEAAEPVPSEVRETAERRSLAGLECVRFDVLRGGERVREVWVADWREVGGGREAFESMARFAGEIFDTAASASVFGNSLLPAGNPFEDLERMGGFPVLSLNFEAGEPASESRLVAVSEGELAASTFEPPVDYRREDLLEP